METEKGEQPFDYDAYVRDAQKLYERLGKRLDGGRAEIMVAQAKRSLATRARAVRTTA